MRDMKATRVITGASLVDYPANTQDTTTEDKTKGNPPNPPPPDQP